MRHRLVALLCLCATALYGPLAAPADAQSGGALESYRIGPRDQVRVRVFEIEELNDLTLRVSDAGAIGLPIIGAINIGGKTQTELARDLEALLEERYVQQATVDVQILEFRSSPISVIGAVNSPGDLPYSGRWSLLDALTAAGGLAPDHGAVLYINRRAASGLSDQIEIDVARLMVRGDPDVNIPIFANDLINVPADTPVTVYCLGEVAHPGALEFRSSENITVLTAIARAGGLTDRAAKKIIVQRPTRFGGQEEIVVDYKRQLAGRDPSVRLQQNDVVIVKESFF